MRDVPKQLKSARSRVRRARASLIRARKEAPEGDRFVEFVERGQGIYRYRLSILSAEDELALAKEALEPLEQALAMAHYAAKLAVDDLMSRRA